jgi:16S rRNA processing protein RimM
MDDPDRLVQVGRVGRPHGTDGAFVVEQASDDDRRWEVGAVVIVDGAPARVTLMRRVGSGRRAIRLDRPVPRGAELSVRLRDLPPPEPDSYYAFQLVGLDVFDDEGAPVGVVAEVLPGPANDNLELGDGRLVPMIEDAIREIDLEVRRIVVAKGFLPG